MVGGYDNDTGDVTDCYYFNTCAAEGTTFTNELGTALTAEQMKNSANFEGFDFTNIWKINIDRPVLRTNLEVQNFKIKSVGTNDTKATATIFIPMAGTYTVVFTDYKNGRLNELDIVPFTVTADKLGENTVISATAITLDKEDKIMIWDNLKNLAPMCDVYEVK